jgi:hypothetical protein
LHSEPVGNLTSRMFCDVTHGLFQIALGARCKNYFELLAHAETRSRN